MIKRKDSGFTVIEIVMVIVLMAIIATVAAMIILQGARSFGDMDVRRELTAEGRLAIERMAREIRLVGCTTSGIACTPTGEITTYTDTDFAFENVNYETRRLQFTSGSLKLTEGLTETVLADNVTGLDFDYLDTSDGDAASVGDVWSIRATLTLSKKGQTLNFRVRVHPRSFR
ncbi:MAG: prepilin-type N-terminal cleavage/methylation domain-containing protein [Thermodesulfobacteriota bacterium]